MEKTLKKKWLKALRSGEYEQGTGALHKVEENTYCCLGVLCEIAGLEKNDDYVEEAVYSFKGEDEQSVLPPTFRAKLNISSSQQDKLTEMNDGDIFADPVVKGSSFLEIADYIEANL